MLLFDSVVYSLADFQYVKSLFSVRLVYITTFPFQVYSSIEVSFEVYRGLQFPSRLKRLHNVVTFFRPSFRITG